VIAHSLDDKPPATTHDPLSLSAADVVGLALPSAAALSGDEPAGQATRWVWPVRGEISQFFSDSHRAIDVVSEHDAVPGHGEAIVAADAGEVVYAEWESSGFGYLVIIDHGDGYRTYYAHLYGFYVDVGKMVERGDLVGQIGNTGNSTAPHLHFEIRHLGISRDPLALLPPLR
jgi:murein DD-endopeptidase MepM/ murein hydrolase activator NlpD